MIQDTPSLRLNSHFQGGPGLATIRMFPFWISFGAMVVEVVATTGAIRRAKLQSNHHHQQTQHPTFFYRPDALPIAQPTVSEH